MHQQMLKNNITCFCLLIEPAEGNAKVIFVLKHVGNFSYGGRLAEREACFIVNAYFVPWRKK